MQASMAAALAAIRLDDVDGRSIELGWLWRDAPAVIAFLRHYG